MNNKIKINDNTIIVVIISTLTNKVNEFGMIRANCKYPFTDNENYEKHILIRANVAKEEYGFEGFTF